MTQQVVHTASIWLSDIGNPLPEIPCGKDPRYLDEFQTVKEEIDKLREVDYEMVVSSCRDLLAGVTKDLRIGGYHLIAGTYVEGLPGLLDGLRAFRVLLNNFWEHCHPQNETGRMAALNLLGNPRIVAFAEQKEEGASIEIYEALQVEVSGINSFLIDKLGEEVPRLLGLARWLEDRMKRLELSAPEKENISSPEPQHPSAQKQKAFGEVSSEQAVENLTRQIHRYLLNEGDYLRAMAYSRAFRWGKVVLPPHEGGRTRIPAPRANGLAEFEKSLSCEPLENFLSGFESLFFEPGFHLLFDLQYQAFRYFENNHRPDLAEFIKNTLLDLLERHTQLLELQFDDKSPFASPECRQWLRGSRLGSGKESVQGTQEEKTKAESTAAAINQAMQLAKQKKLTDALQCIRCLPSGNEKQRIRKRLTETQLCLSAGKPHLAEVILAEVQKYILDQHLATWDPGLAIEVLQQRLATLQTLGKSCPSENKLHIGRQVQEVQQLICRIDLAAAAILI